MNMKANEAIVRYKSVRSKVREMGVLCNKLMRCPDVDQADLIAAHVAYQNAWNKFQTARAILRAKYRTDNLLFSYPWETDDETL